MADDATSRARGRPTEPQHRRLRVTRDDYPDDPLAQMLWLRERVHACTASSGEQLRYAELAEEHGDPVEAFVAIERLLTRFRRHEDMLAVRARLLERHPDLPERCAHADNDAQLRVPDLLPEAVGSAGAARKRRAQRFASTTSARAVPRRIVGVLKRRGYTTRGDLQRMIACYLMYASRGGVGAEVLRALLKRLKAYHGPTFLASMASVPDLFIAVEDATGIAAAWLPTTDAKQIGKQVGLWVAR